MTKSCVICGEEFNARGPKKMSAGPYRVVKDKIVMMELVTLTRKDLLRMLTEIS